MINFLKNNENAIDVDFVLAGDTSNPRFSINEAIANRVAMGMAAELGVSIRGLAEDFGTLGRRSVEGAAGVAEGVSFRAEGRLWWYQTVIDLLTAAVQNADTALPWYSISSSISNQAS